MTQVSRLRSVDVLRGLACVLMAIDHVRVYSGLPAGGPTPGIFFTRWITHFVAPAFCFLAGTAAFFHGRKLGNRGALAKYLASRGLLLVFLELTLIRFLWTFNLDYAHYLLAGVIWMLGVSMVLLAIIIWFPMGWIVTLGALVVFGQQLLGLVGQGAAGGFAVVLQFLYTGGPLELWSGGPTLAILYSIVPWVGVMALGYAFGTVLTKEPAERTRLSLGIGLAATALFLLVAGVRAWSAGGSDEAPPLFVRLLGQQKYPASELFLLMTLGPTIALLPWAERARGFVSNALDTIGRVPLFYYLLHIPVIHLAAMVVSTLRTGAVDPWLFGNHPMFPPDLPVGYQWSLGLLYLVFALVVAILYLACRWYAEVKARRPDGVLHYL